MDIRQSERFIRNLFLACLDRDPSKTELAHWVASTETTTPDEIASRFLSSDEYKKKRGVKPAFYNGHYYSPVVDPSTVKEYVTVERTTEFSRIPGIPISLEEMTGLWDRNLDFIRLTPIDEVAAERRYYHENGGYPLGDAVFLRAMLNELKPRRIIEIGSGFSTACMLDAIEQAGIKDFRLTCIEPYADRLKSLLRPDDPVELIEKPVQEVPLSLFTELGRDDILFIDSTHILKTGSDVHHELFHILPSLRSGVTIHFHDIPFPFEYPDEWIFDRNYSWNEAYALRAFLSYNSQFRVVFWNALFAIKRREHLLNTYPKFPGNPGTGIWLRRR
jgi:predicted O-methyltransferase YrrM